MRVDWQWGTFQAVLSENCSPAWQIAWPLSFSTNWGSVFHKMVFIVCHFFKLCQNLWHVYIFTKPNETMTYILQYTLALDFMHYKFTPSKMFWTWRKMSFRFQTFQCDFELLPIGAYRAWAGEGGRDGEGIHPLASQYCTTGYGGGSLFTLKGKQSCPSSFVYTWKIDLWYTKHIALFQASCTNFKDYNFCQSRSFHVKSLHTPGLTLACVGFFGKKLGGRLMSFFFIISMKTQGSACYYTNAGFHTHVVLPCCSECMSLAAGITKENSLQGDKPMKFMTLPALETLNGSNSFQVKWLRRSASPHQSQTLHFIFRSTLKQYWSSLKSTQGTRRAAFI